MLRCFKTLLFQSRSSCFERFIFLYITTPDFGVVILLMNRGVIPPTFQVGAAFCGGSANHPVASAAMSAQDGILRGDSFLKGCDEMRHTDYVGMDITI